ncbi:hypothetical protein FRC08_011015 [Ceratobasidium sp. 394]|nr:hypothetical protein FRC08_011015 [Ceratobasidium sp. 394]
MSPSFPKKSQLRLAFIASAFLVQILDPKISPFDTSHMIRSQTESDDIHESQDSLGPVDVSSRLGSASDIASAGARSSPDSSIFSLHAPQLIDSSGLRWDALHYHALALHGSYIFEHQYAFSPGVPIVLRLVRQGKLYLLRLLDYFHVERLFSEDLVAFIQHMLILTAKAGLIGLLASEPCLEIYK